MCQETNKRKAFISLKQAVQYGEVISSELYLQLKSLYILENKSGLSD